MSKLIETNDPDLVDRLKDEPETGMGYHVVVDDEGKEHTYINCGEYELVDSDS